MDLTTLTDRIDITTQNVLNSFQRLTEEQLNWKADAKTWSVAQNLEHIILNNESYFKVFERLLENRNKTPFLGKMRWFTNSFGNAILKAVQPDRRKKISTFPMWEPTTSHINKDIIDRFEEHQSQLKAYLEACWKIAEAGVVISSPANRFIVYRLETAFEIIVTHGERHLQQARELLPYIPDA